MVGHEQADRENLHEKPVWHRVKLKNVFLDLLLARDHAYAGLYTVENHSSSTSQPIIMVHGQA